MNEMLNRPLGTDHWGQTTVFGCFSQLTVAMSGNRGLSVRSNSSQSSGLKSRPGSCPYAPVA